MAIVLAFPGWLEEYLPPQSARSLGPEERIRGGTRARAQRGKTVDTKQDVFSNFIVALF